MSNFVNLLDIIYPVGSIYIATDDADPVDIVGGIWVEQTNYFIPLLNTWGHTNGLNQNTIGDITLLTGFTSIGLSNYAPGHKAHLHYALILLAMVLLILECLVFHKALSLLSGIEKFKILAHIRTKLTVIQVTGKPLLVLGKLRIL